ncbi:hypothetical protein, partial [Salmonella sp. SAL4437]|uniref:hypothetical protein n=1 Tax=Salmonella sp. SAL4437 TaxID=3159892 RepID=UPI00397DCED8
GLQRTLPSPYMFEQVTVWPALDPALGVPQAAIDVGPEAVPVLRSGVERDDPGESVGAANGQGVAPGYRAGVEQVDAVLD